MDLFCIDDADGDVICCIVDVNGLISFKSFWANIDDKLLCCWEDIIKPYVSVYYEIKSNFMFNRFKTSTTTNF